MATSKKHLRIEMDNCDDDSSINFDGSIKESIGNSGSDTLSIYLPDGTKVQFQHNEDTGIWKASNPKAGPNPIQIVDAAEEACSDVVNILETVPYAVVIEEGGDEERTLVGEVEIGKQHEKTLKSLERLFANSDDFDTHKESVKAVLNGMMLQI